MSTTIWIQEKQLSQLKDIQENIYGTQKVPYYTTLDVMFQDKLEELNNETE